MQAEGPKFPILLNRMSVMYKIVLRSFIKRDVLDKTKFNLIQVDLPHNFKPLESHYCGAKVEIFMNEQLEKRAITQNQITNLKKHIVYK
jgi:hypothetical protein